MVCVVIFLILKLENDLDSRILQEGWLPPTKRASAVKTRMNGLSCGEKNYDNTFSRFDTIPACDRQTDGRTEFEYL